MPSKPAQSSDTEVRKSEDRTAIRASAYNFDQLAHVYSEARTDYIVPMPMNGKRMQEYVVNYDIDLDASFVVLNADQEETGVGMLGIRDDRSWITRLGVLPHRRGTKTGQYLMDLMVEESIRREMRLIQLEVIVGNEPARHLFQKVGFEPTRELLVIRRPPKAPDANPDYDVFSPLVLTDEEIVNCLNQREPGASWVEETASLLNAGSLEGRLIEMPSGEIGWIVFQRAAFKLAHLVFSPNVEHITMHALLYHVHKEFAMYDTIVENVPSDHETWEIYQSQGYVDSFRRTEMFLYL